MPRQRHENAAASQRVGLESPTYVSHGSYNRAVPFNENLPVNFARAMPNWQPLVEYRRNGVA